MKAFGIWNQVGKTEMKSIPLERIVSSPYQPRSRYDLQKIDALAASIAQHGVLSPLLVRKIRGNAYEVIAGERRLRAHKRAEKHHQAGCNVDGKLEQYKPLDILIE